MTPIFSVERAFVRIGKEEFDNLALKAEPLEDGEHCLEQAGVQVPFRIGGERITIDIAGAKGNLAVGWVPAMGDDWTLANRGNIIEITV